MKTIGILGSSRGEGVTTLCIAMANYLAEVMSARIAILECNDSKAFELMTLEVCCENCESGYKIGKVNYFYDIELSAFLVAYAGNYDYVIIDFGNHMKGFRDNYHKLRHKIILGSALPYKSGFHRLLKNSIEGFGMPEEFLHLLSGDAKSVKEYSAKCKINALPAPVIVNPYILESKLASFFQLLF